MNWEKSFLYFMNHIRSQTLSSVFETITVTAEIGLILVVISIIYWCINKRLGQKLGFIMLFSLTYNGLIKNLVKAPRPFELGIIEPLRKHTATGYSFPSGHTQSATTFWVVLMNNIKQRWLYYLGTIMIVLVAVSRLYLGVHWPKDVIAAIFVGLVLGLIGEYIYKSVERLKYLGVLLWIYIPILSSLIWGMDGDYIKAIGAITGFIIGHGIENKYICFKEKGSLKHQFFKVSIGMLGVVILLIGLKLLLPKENIYNFIRYAIVVIWIIAGAPYTFVKLF